MSASHDIFIHPVNDQANLLTDASAACGEALRKRGTDPVSYYARTEGTLIELEFSHEYEADQGIPFEDYEMVLTVWDNDRNEERQERTAREIFDNLKATGNYSLLLVFDLQELVDAAPPLPGQYA